MKKSLLLLSLAALFAAPASVLADHEENTGSIETTGFVTDKSGETVVSDKASQGWVDPFAPHVTPDRTASFGPGEFKAEFVAEASNPTPKANQEPVYEVREVTINGVTGVKAVLVGYVDKTAATPAPAAEAKKEEAPKAEVKKEEAKPAAKAVKAAATKTASKALPKTSAAK